MPTVGAFEAKNRLGALLDLVERGEEVTITRHGKPVAKLVAPATSETQQQKPFDKEAAKAAVEAIREMRKGVTLGGISVRELIDEGRR
ncbi:MAG: type II toxin-antitoxin system Phd/YefM family antitoxin [Mesorhizobium sp.]